MLNPRGFRYCQLLHKGKELWDEAKAVSGFPTCDCKKCECGVNGKLYKYSEEQRLIQFLMGLNGSYTAIRGSILMMTPFPSMSQVYSLLIQEERQRQVKSEPQFLGDNASFTAGTTKPAAFQRRKSNLFCEHCKKTGHTMEKCYKIHGYPSKPQNRGRGVYQHASNRKAYNTWTEQAAQETQSTQAEMQTPNLPGLNPEQTKQLYQYLANLTTNGATKASDLEMNATNMAGIFSSITAASISNARCFTCQLGNDIWILDSGASDHMSYDARSLHGLRSLDTPIIVSLPNGQQVQVSDCGTLKLNNWI